MRGMQPKKIIRKVVPRSGLRALEQGYRKSRGLAWQARYGFPARGMRVIAVTGTNGKTTTCSYINEVLKAGGHSTAVLTTAYYEIAGEREANRTHYTIDRQSIVQDFFARSRKAGVNFVVLEVTSHALHQARIMGVTVEVAVITNLTQEHLDYHGTMEEYAKAKALLLQKYGAKHAVLNADDEWFKFFSQHSKAEVHRFSKDITLKTSLIGDFNLYNATAAATVGQVLGIDRQQIEQGIANLKAVPGRMETIDEGQNFTVIVDFAYTPDALENVLSSLQKVTKGKISIVFGATGDRDTTKRGPMGEVVARLADRIYLTDDETYTEDPITIRDAVYAGIKKASGVKKTKVIDDRLDAIKLAFKEANKGDVVLLAGIGHEDYRNMGGHKLPWDERQVARRELRKT